MSSRTQTIACSIALAFLFATPSMALQISLSRNFPARLADALSTEEPQQQPARQDITTQSQPTQPIASSPRQVTETPSYVRSSNAFSNRATSSGAYRKPASRTVGTSVLAQRPMTPFANAQQAPPNPLAQTTAPEFGTVMTFPAAQESFGAEVSFGDSQQGGPSVQTQTPNALLTPNQLAELTKARMEADRRKQDYERAQSEMQRQLQDQQRRINQLTGVVQEQTEETSRQKLIEQQLRAEQQQLLEEKQRLADHAKTLEEQKLRQEKLLRQAEQARIADRERVAEQARLAERKRLENELAEKTRIAKEQRAKQKLAEQQRLIEQQKIYEQARIAEQTQLEQKQRIAELEIERMAEQERQAKEQQRLEKERLIRQNIVAEQNRIAEKLRVEEQQRLAAQAIQSPQPKPFNATTDSNLPPLMTPEQHFAEQQRIREQQEIARQAEQARIEEQQRIAHQKRMAEQLTLQPPIERESTDGFPPIIQSGDMSSRSGFGPTGSVQANLGAASNTAVPAQPASTQLSDNLFSNGRADGMPQPPIGITPIDLKTSVIGPEALVAGTPDEFEIIVSNNGGEVARDIIVQITIPGDLTVSKLDRDAWLDEENRTVSWKLSMINNNEKEVIKYSAVSQTAGRYPQQVTIGIGNKRKGQTSFDTVVITQEEFESNYEDRE